MLPRWLVTFRAFALASAFAAAFVPIATYITNDKRDWLWIHIGVNIAAYIAVALTTIYTTVNLTQQDHNKHPVPAYWANNAVMRTWYLGVTKTWRWHVAAAVGRLGLALAMMQHINVSCGYSYGCAEDHFIFTPHIYISYTSMTYPVWQTIIAAFVVLIGFSILEAALVSALTMLFASTRTSHALTSLHPLFLRLGIIFIFVLTLMLFDTPQSSPTPPPYGQQYERGYDKQVYRSGLVPWYFVAFNWFDDGTMVAAKVLRPPESYGGYGCSSCGFSVPRPHVMIAVIETLSAYTTYILVIIASLQFAQYWHWRREQRESPTPAPTTP